MVDTSGYCDLITYHLAHFPFAPEEITKVEVCISFCFIYLMLSFIYLMLSFILFYFHILYMYTTRVLSEPGNPSMNKWIFYIQLRPIFLNANFYQVNAYLGDLCM